MSQLAKDLDSALFSGIVATGKGAYKGLKNVWGNISGKYIKETQKAKTHFQNTFNHAHPQKSFIDKAYMKARRMEFDDQIKKHKWAAGATGMAILAPVTYGYATGRFENIAERMRPSYLGSYEGNAQKLASALVPSLGNNTAYLDQQNIPTDTRKPISAPPGQEMDYFDYQEWALGGQTTPDRTDHPVASVVHDEVPKEASVHSPAYVNKLAGAIALHTSNELGIDKLAYSDATPGEKLLGLAIAAYAAGAAVNAAASIKPAKGDMKPRYAM